MGRIGAIIELREVRSFPMVGICSGLLSTCNVDFCDLLLLLLSSLSLSMLLIVNLYKQGGPKVTPPLIFRVRSLAGKLHQAINSIRGTVYNESDVARLLDHPVQSPLLKDTFYCRLKAAFTMALTYIGRSVFKMANDKVELPPWKLTIDRGPGGLSTIRTTAAATTSKATTTTAAAATATSASVAAISRKSLLSPHTRQFVFCYTHTLSLSAIRNVGELLPYFKERGREREREREKERERGEREERERLQQSMHIVYYKPLLANFD